MLHITTSKMNRGRILHHYMSGKKESTFNGAILTLESAPSCGGVVSGCSVHYWFHLEILLRGGRTKVLKIFGRVTVQVAK